MKCKIESKFLVYTDISDTEDTVVTITGNGEEVFGRGREAEDKPILYFKEIKKPFGLNITNRKVLIKLFGTDEMDQWIGKKISLFVKDDIDYRGDLVSGIRVRSTVPNEPKTEPKESKKTKPFSVPMFIQEVNGVSTTDGLWALQTQLSAAQISEDERVSLYKFLFQRLDELKPRGQSNEQEPDR